MESSALQPDTELLLSRSAVCEVPDLSACTSRPGVGIVVAQQTSETLYRSIGPGNRSLMRRELITVGQALQAVSVFESIPIRFVDVELADVVEIIDRHKIWACDAYSIRCARKYRTPLLSLDKNQCRIAELENVTVPEVSS